MKVRKTLGIIVVSVLIIIASGCISKEQYDGLKDQNRIQQETITDMESQLNIANLQLKQLKAQLETLQAQANANIGAKHSEITALEKDIAEKKALIEKLQKAMLSGGIKLPMELSMLLQDFAKDNDMVTFDDKNGVLKFKSDFLFKSGSAEVQSGALSAVKALSDILNTDDGKKFDVIIAGHTDNDPIIYSKAQHPTNWHLSAHRAIGVLKQMATNGISAKRLSVRGFGEYRPVTSNDSKEGKSANRRVEIYIVPAGS